MGSNKADTGVVEDDFFGEQTDTGAAGEKGAREREWNALRREHVRAGYREGSEAGHDAKVQSGFDDGFLAGAKATAGAGYWLGVAAVIEAYRKMTIPESLLQEVRDARIALEKAANGIKDSGDNTDGNVSSSALDTSAIQAACTKIIGNPNTNGSADEQGNTT